MANLTDRMRGYEAVTKQRLLRKCPVIVRVDGNCFHTWTLNLKRPFDMNLAVEMNSAAMNCAFNMQGFLAAYIQSDEISFLLSDLTHHESEPWFGYVTQKVASITAAMATAFFNTAGLGPPAWFDGRAFNVPREDVSNYFLWRMKDWERNSLQMFARAYFSHRELYGKKHADMHEMLHKIGRNWTIDVPPMFRNGRWVFSNGLCRTDILPTYPTIAEIIEPLLKSEGN